MYTYDDWELEKNSLPQATTTTTTTTRRSRIKWKTGRWEHLRSVCKNRTRLGFVSIGARWLVVALNDKVLCFLTIKKKKEKTRSPDCRLACYTRIPSFPHFSVCIKARRNDYRLVNAAPAISYGFHAFPINERIKQSGCNANGDVISYCLLVLLVSRPNQPSTTTTYNRPAPVGGLFFLKNSVPAPNGRLKCWAPYSGCRAISARISQWFICLPNE